MTPRSQHACFGKPLGFYSRTSEAAGTGIGFASFVPSQTARPLSGTVLSGRAHLHREGVSDQGKRTETGRRAQSGIGCAGFQPPRSQLGRRGRGLGFRHRGSTLMPRRLRGRATIAWHVPILGDQGLDEASLAVQLHLDELRHAAASSGQDLTLRCQTGYDRSFRFIQSLIKNHVAHHARHLLG